jgi:hypothetical protein
MAAPAGTSVRIETDIFNDASKLIIIDKSVWMSEASTVKDVQLTIVSNTSMNGYYHDIVLNSGSKVELTAFISQGLQLAPSTFFKDGVQCDLDAFPDGRYEITLSVKYSNDWVSTYTDNQGFIPFVENAIQRVQIDMKGSALERFVNIHIYAYGAKAAGSVGKIEQFDTLVDLINAKLNNYLISYP